MDDPHIIRIGYRQMLLADDLTCVDLVSQEKVVAPVSVSPLITAQLIGAAPLYWGSKEAWRLNVPRRGIFQTTSGSIRKATTICKSAFKARNSERKASSFNFSGWSTGNPFDRAYRFTGLACKTLP